MIFIAVRALYTYIQLIKRQKALTRFYKETHPHDRLIGNTTKMYTVFYHG